jgi:tRNA-dihydrouridine synthase
LNTPRNINIAFAPIQGITDANFRNTYALFFKGVNRYFAPYLRFDGKHQLKASMVKDLKRENNSTIHLVPQIMVNNINDFLELDSILSDFGFTELNWNIGCPYPMVTNRKLGAGLLPYHNEIVNILNDVVAKCKLKVSVKMRSGLTDHSLLPDLLSKFNLFPLSEIIIHPRYARQLYKEEANSQVFFDNYKQSEHVLCYNGDIYSLSYFNSLSVQIPEISRYMLGRGLIANPFLAEQIKSNSIEISGDKNKLFWQFHELLCEGVLKNIQNPSQAVIRMRSYWEYFSNSFTNRHKTFKKIKKASNINKYVEAVNYIKHNEEWLC